MEHERPKVGVGVIILKDGKILLGERLLSHGAGSYSLPGGHMEFDESFEETAKREAEEETGLTSIVVRDLVCVSNDRVYGKHFITIGMIADWTSGDPVVMEPEKAANWAWYTPEEIPENLFLPSKAVIEHWLAGKIYIP
jgi:8-oxo-dGTP diphosphatase